jgi:hypothetical protein
MYICMYMLYVADFIYMMCIRSQEGGNSNLRYGLYVGGCVTLSVTGAIAPTIRAEPGTL